MVTGMGTGTNTGAGVNELYGSQSEMRKIKIKRRGKEIGQKCSPFRQFRSTSHTLQP
jgi:hypothetical protein